ncbi:sialic acid TRAP transporter substrate-binding protein SiaP [Acuticoccus mangrovi]|uniref:Sialic acid TRAP transporter substrate-binding protein SiaP n=1 Tax=Acuticoccus mangrovi TaxID=2796142 RepID=A0A934INQ5_9HYPH|nr:sialic acid TRAP transporter substrate-binding protein SiaP [Acuticoccus mangrovi]MBJ3775806.1 sialic acid TRAP transporter substrate-binding protein SiaP [Acuticoccus mangrovi]
MRSQALRAALVAAFAGAVATTALADEFRFAHVYEANSIYHKWAEWAADEIASRTDGRHTVEVFPASSLGKEAEIFEGLALGTIDMSYTGSFYASSVYGPMAISSAPYMFRDFDHWKAYRDSPVFAEISGTFEAQSGHEVLGLTYYGARHLTANKALPTPESMKGLKMRVPNAKMYLLFPRSVGANPTPIAFAEVYLALQQGVVDAQENPLPTILEKKFYEVQSHIMLTGHLMDSLVTLMAGPKWRSLGADDQTIFAEVYAEAAAKATEDVRQAELRLAEDFATELGIEVVEVDRAPFREAMMPLLTSGDVPWTPEQVAAVEAIR